jgi:hypothetical protein
MTCSLKRAADFTCRITWSNSAATCIESDALLHPVFGCHQQQLQHDYQKQHVKPHHFLCIALVSPHLQVLAASPLSDYLATTAVTANTTLGQLVDSKQRALLLFYDQWTSPSGFKVGSKVSSSLHCSCHTQQLT